MPRSVQIKPATMTLNRIEFNIDYRARFRNKLLQLWEDLGLVENKTTQQSFAGAWAELWNTLSKWVKIHRMKPVALTLSTIFKERNLFIISNL